MRAHTLEKDRQRVREECEFTFLMDCFIIFGVMAKMLTLIYVEIFASFAFYFRDKSGHTKK